MYPESKRLVSEVTVCAVPSSFIQVTVLLTPITTWMVLGEYPLLVMSLPAFGRMETIADSGLRVALGEEEAREALLADVETVV
jgi:hypothetical protein